MHLILSSKAETIINESDNNDTFDQSVLQLYHMQNYRKGLDWIIDSVVDCTINVSNFKPLSDSSCIKLPKKLKWMIYEIFD